MDPHTPLQDEGDESMMDLVEGSSPEKDTETRRKHGDNEHRNRQLSVLIVNIETDVPAE